MSTFTATAGRTAGVTTRGTVAAGLAGAVVFGLAMAAGMAFDLNADGKTGRPRSSRPSSGSTSCLRWSRSLWPGGWAGTHWPGRPTGSPGPHSAWGSPPAATVAVFWTGWPLVFGAVATLLSAGAPPPAGLVRTTAVAATALGSLALLISAYFCVTG